MLRAADREGRLLGNLRRADAALPVHDFLGPEAAKHGVVLRDLHRVIGGDESRGRRQNEFLGRGGDVAEHRGGAVRDERRVMVLAESKDLEADLSLFFALVTMSVIRWCSDGVFPVVGSIVTSPTVRIPN